MHHSFKLLLFFLSPILSVPISLPAQTVPPSPLVLPQDSPRLHLLSQPPPAYPPIARAAHVEGNVVLHIEIGPDGHITSARVLSGPGMLQGAAEDALRLWVYAPVLEGGKPTAASTTVTIPFVFSAPPSQYAKPSPMKQQDWNLLQRQRLEAQSCTDALASTAPPSRQVQVCQKAADLADQFSAGVFGPRSSAFTYLSTALRRNQQLPEALAAANKAVAAIQAGWEQGAVAAAAYSVRAEAEAQLGQFNNASADLAIAEDEERSSITHMEDPSGDKNWSKMTQAFSKSNFVPVLKGLLLYHAKILTALGKPAEAAAKMSEADKL